MERYFPYVVFCGTQASFYGTVIMELPMTAPVFLEPKGRSSKLILRHASAIESAYDISVIKIILAIVAIILTLLPLFVAHALRANEHAEQQQLRNERTLRVGEQLAPANDVKTVTRQARQ
jgi:hypothetical protein